MLHHKPNSEVDREGLYGAQQNVHFLKLFKGVFDDRLIQFEFELGFVVFVINRVVNNRLDFFKFNSALDVELSGQQLDLVGIDFHDNGRGLTHLLFQKEAEEDLFAAFRDFSASEFLVVASFHDRPHDAHVQMFFHFLFVQ